MRLRWISLASLLAALSFTASGQDSRGSIAGRVTDPTGAVIPNVAVVVTNTETNTVARSTTNETGYFEASLLNPGTYSVAAEAEGFKRVVRTGLVLNVAGRLEIPLQLEVGQVSESVEVTAAAPLLDTTTASGGRVVDSRQVMELPLTNNNPFALTALAPGMQSTGAPQALRPFDNGGTSDFNTMGGVGQNEFTIDGAPVNGSGRRVGFIPPQDSVGEFKLETTPFDASYGFTSGAVINVMTRSGTNRYRGSVFNQHWQQRWNATPHFTRLSWENSVRQGRISPDAQKQESGRQNNFGATFGGPVRIPKLYDGRDKLFFFLTYNGVYQAKSETLTDIIYNTVPKQAWRQGDFSDLLAVDVVRYTIYDPRSARRDGSRVVRTPFPGNRGVPVLNPAHNFYANLMPAPNDVPGLVSAEGFNNYFASAVPNLSEFNSLVNRVDYNLSERQRLTGRWHWNKRTADTRDWLYETRRGLATVDLNRLNLGAGVNYSYTFSPAHLMDAGVNFSRFSEGNLTPGMVQVKPSEVGLPAYLDAKAGALTTLPALDFNSIPDFGRVYGQIQRRAVIGEAKINMTSIRGNHTVRYGWSERRYRYSSADNGYSSGLFGFNNQWVRQANDTNTASNHALEWAAFRMGVPSSATIDTNDTGYNVSRYRALFVQDDWRLTSRLRLNLGLRYERETGIRERFNRGIGGGFLFDAPLPFSQLAQAAYARAPLPELPAAQFRTLGGVEFLGASTRDFTSGTHNLLPRAGVVYQLNNKTVLRGGYGRFSDTFNPNNTQPSQFGFSQPTATNISTDAGLTFCCGVGAASGLGASANPMADPFPVRADGTRFDTPAGASLGSYALAGRGLTFFPRDYRPAMQQRWRLGVQRELTRDMVLEVSYNGAFSRQHIAQPVSFLPEQYWAAGNTRNNALDNELNRNVPNPFHIANLADLRTSDPAAYRYLSSQTFFNATVIRKHQLLRAFPQMSSLAGVRPGASFDDTLGGNRYHDLQVQLERRFARGFQTAVLYTRAYNEEQDFYNNEFDLAPSYRPSDQVRPNRFVWSAIWEMPFGRDRAFVKSGPLQHVVGGWQLSWIYVYQDGPPTNWANRFFYGDLNNIASLFNQSDVHGRDMHVWFDPSIAYRGAGAVPQNFQGFEGRSANQPGQYHVRVFPTRLDMLRADGLRNWDVKLLRRFRITETIGAAFSVDLLNATNHTNLGAPVTDPANTNFGRITTQNGQSRFIQLNLRVDF